MAGISNGWGSGVKNHIVVVAKRGHDKAWILRRAMDRAIARGFSNEPRTD